LTWSGPIARTLHICEEGPISFRPVADESQASGESLDVAQANAKLAELAATIGLAIARPALPITPAPPNAPTPPDTFEAITGPESPVKPATLHSAPAGDAWSQLRAYIREWQAYVPTMQAEMQANALPLAGFVCLGFIVMLVVLATAGPQTSVSRPTQTANATPRPAPLRDLRSTRVDDVVPKHAQTVVLPPIDSVFGSLRPITDDTNGRSNLALAPPASPPADFDGQSAIHDLTDHKDWMATITPQAPPSGPPAQGHRAPRGDLRRVAAEDIAKPPKTDLRSLTLPRESLPDLAIGRNR
jgi:hypothetical protein